MVAEDVVAAADVIVAADVDEGGNMAGEDVMIVIAETDIIVAADVDADVKGKGGELVRAAALLLAALDVTRKEIATVLPEFDVADGAGESGSKLFDLQYDQIISPRFHADDRNRAESGI